MPVSLLTFVYGLCILAGIVLVAYGVRPESREKGAPPDCRRCSLLDELTHPTSEVIPLQFTADQGPTDERRFDASEDEPSNLTIPEHIRIKYSPKPPSTSFLRALKAPFRLLSRGKSPEQILDRPVAAGIELTPKILAGMDDRKHDED